jgi:hypothetical protein
MWRPSERRGLEDGAGELELGGDPRVASRVDNQKRELPPLPEVIDRTVGL